MGFISFLFSWPGHAACTPSSGSTDSLGTGPPGNSLQWVSTNVYTFASTMTTKITKYLCHLRKFLTFSPGNPHFAKAPKILNTDHVRLVLSLLINEVVHYIHLWAWLLSVNNRWVKRTLAALGKNISSRMFSTALFHSTLNSTGDKDLMCITPWTSQQPHVTFCYREREKGRFAKRDALAFLSVFFLPHSRFGRKENTSTKKVPLILPKLQKTPNSGL